MSNGINYFPYKGEKKFPLPKALLFVLLSVVVIWGTLFCAWWYHDKIVQKRKTNSRFVIEGIVASCSDPDSLTSRQLATLLGVDSKKPCGLYVFDPEEAERTCRAFPAIKTATVSRIRPNAVAISYAMRKPVVQLADFENVALDVEGYPFPLFPYYSPKRLPEFFLGVDALSWNTAIASLEFQEAKRVLDAFNALFGKLAKEDLRLIRVDTSQVKAASRGKREVVVILEEGGSGRYFLRLKVGEYNRSFAEFRSLMPVLKEKQGAGVPKEHIVDLRYNGFALIN